MVLADKSNPQVRTRATIRDNREDRVNQMTVKTVGSGEAIEKVRANVLGTNILERGRVIQRRAMSVGGGLQNASVGRGTNKMGRV